VFRRLIWGIRCRYSVREPLTALMMDAAAIRAGAETRAEARL
jgi:hypothetical protein